MGNPSRGEASFEALGELWTLRFNTNALAEFEEVAGVAATSIGGGLSIKTLRALVWAGLGFHHRRKRGTLENVGNMIDDAGAMVIGELVGKALASAYPESKGEVAESPPKAAQSEDGLTS